MSCMICGRQKEFAVWVDCDGEKIGVCHPCREVALEAFKQMELEEQGRVEVKKIIKESEAKR